MRKKKNIIDTDEGLFKFTRFIRENNLTIEDIKKLISDRQKLYKLRIEIAELRAKIAEERLNFELERKKSIL